MEEILKNTRLQLRKYKIVFIIFFSIEIFLNIVLPIKIKILIDFIQSKNLINFHFKIISIVLLILFLLVVSFIDQYFFRLIQAKGEAYTKINMYKYLLTKEPKFFLENNADKIISNMNLDLKTISSWLSNGSLLFIMENLILLSYMSIIFFLDKLIFFMLILIFAISFFLVNKISEKIVEYEKSYYDGIEELNKLYYKIIFNIYQVVQLKKEKYFNKLFKNKIEHINIKKISIYISLERIMLDTLLFLLPFFIFFMRNNFSELGLGISVLFFVSKLNEPVFILGDLINQRKLYKLLVKKLEVSYKNNIY